jgi:chromosome condensin MukBEF ATPase and DNA-binding subunit MukB
MTESESTHYTNKEIVRYVNEFLQQHQKRPLTFKEIVMLRNEFDEEYKYLTPHWGTKRGFINELSHDFGQYILSSIDELPAPFWRSVTRFSRRNTVRKPRDTRDNSEFITEIKEIESKLSNLLTPLQERKYAYDAHIKRVKKTSTMMGDSSRPETYTSMANSRVSQQLTDYYDQINTRDLPDANACMTPSTRKSIRDCKTWISAMNRKIYRIERFLSINTGKFGTGFMKPLRKSRKRPNARPR